MLASFDKLRTSRVSDKTKCATCAVAIKLLACLICFLTVLVNASHLFLKNVRLEKIKNTEGSAMSIGLLVV